MTRHLVQSKSYLPRISAHDTANAELAATPPYQPNLAGHTEVLTPIQRGFEFNLPLLRDPPQRRDERMEVNYRAAGSVLAEPTMISTQAQLDEARMTDPSCFPRLNGASPRPQGVVERIHRLGEDSPYDFHPPCDAISSVNPSPRLPGCSHIGQRLLTMPPSGEFRSAFERQSSRVPILPGMVGTDCGRYAGRGGSSGFSSVGSQRSGDGTMHYDETVRADYASSLSQRLPRIAQ